MHAVESYLAAWRLRPTATALEAYLELLEPSGLPWSVAVLGGDMVGCGLAELAIRRGGHVRVGLEDYTGPGEPVSPRGAALPKAGQAECQLRWPGAPQIAQPAAPG